MAANAAGRAHHPAADTINPDQSPRQAIAELAAWRAGWQEGFFLGFEAGRAAEGFERDLAWQEMARPVVRSRSATTSRFGAT